MRPPAAFGAAYFEEVRSHGGVVAVHACGGFLAQGRARRLDPSGPDQRSQPALRPAYGRRAMSARIQPHKVRGRQLEEVREKGPDGRIVVHHCTVDMLG
jgi:hypothetical protein